MKAPSLTSRILLVLIATLLLTLSATLAWGAVSDYQVRGLIPKGVTVAGADLSGMTDAQARDAIEAAVSTPMLRTVTVTGDSRSWTLDPAGLVSIDTDAMLNEAYASRRSATFVTRLDSQLRGTPLPNEVKPIYSVNTTGIASWVAQTATQIDRHSVPATRTIVGYKFKITRETWGARVNKAASTAAIAKVLDAEAALTGGDRTAALVVKPLKPKVQAKDFKTAIIVSLAQCKIRLYKGAKLEKTYLCAPGRPGFPTPSGDFQIVTKKRFSPWYNPGTAWAKSMPKVIPAGPNNPMGITKIGINYSGVFFHGVPPGEFSSIGTHASHGCMRMLPSTVLDLFGRVKIGDPVYIRP